MKPGGAHLGSRSLQRLRYYWDGQGPLWKAFWLYGVLGSGLAAALALAVINAGWPRLGLLLAALYSLWVVVSIWRCAFNVEDPNWGYAARSVCIVWALNVLLGGLFLLLDLS